MARVSRQETGRTFAQDFEVLSLEDHLVWSPWHEASTAKRCPGGEVAAVIESKAWISRYGERCPGDALA